MKRLSLAIMCMLLCSVAGILAARFAYSARFADSRIDTVYRKQAIRQISNTVDTNSLPRHLHVAMQYIGYMENKNNSGQFVDWLMASCNIPAGSKASWCSGFVSRVMDEADVSYPDWRTALANGYKKNGYIKASEVKSGKKKLDKDKYYLTIWTKGTTAMGHIGFEMLYKNGKLYTIEGNTGTGNGGSQSNGDIVAFRQRTIQPYAYFRITAFVEIKYERQKGLYANSIPNRDGVNTWNRTLLF